MDGRGQVDESVPIMIDVASYGSVISPGGLERSRFPWRDRPMFLRPLVEDSVLDGVRVPDQDEALVGDLGRPELVEL